MIVEKIKIEKSDNVATVVFDLSPTDIVQYSDIPEVVNKVYHELQNVNAEVVKITGRGPIWLYSAVVHVVAHLAKCVTVYDAVNKKYVIVVSHSYDYHLGETL